MPTSLLEGKRLLLTGVLTPQSIAFSVAQVAQEQGAELVLTGFGKSMGLTERSAKRLPKPVDVLELDANDDAHIERLANDLRTRWGGLDGILHAIAFAPQDALGQNVELGLGASRSIGRLESLAFERGEVFIVTILQNRFKHVPHLTHRSLLQKTCSL